MWLTPVLALSSLLFLLAASASASEIKSDETVVFFPTTATPDEAGTGWNVSIHGWIFEPERDSKWRRTVIQEVQERLGAEPDTPEGRRCAERASLFLVDNEGRKRLSIRIAGRVHELDRSGGDGHFAGSLRLDAAEVAAHARDDRLAFEAVTRPEDSRRFPGQCLLVPKVGVSVISDIDDTIKVSDVLDRRELLRHTFLLPFEAVPGMPAAYAAWARKGATMFHYVSSSPWQLYVPLSTFASSVGLPDGAYHLKAFRLAGTSLLNLFKSSLEIKLPAIRRILARFPDHTFLLVGDSGEKDPEIYGRVAREHPGRVRHVFIRRVEGADNRPERFAEAFRGLPQTLWTLFTDPANLTSSYATSASR